MSTMQNIIVDYLVLPLSRLISIGSIFYYSSALLASLEFLLTKSDSTILFNPQVSIIKPLCGADRNTYSALASFCKQDYSDFEIIFAVERADDPAITVVNQLINSFPKLDIKLVISQKKLGPNNKVNNMANAINSANFAIYILADSDIYVDENYIRRVVQPLQNPCVGMVTAMYRTRAHSGIAAFEALSTSTDFFPSVLLARRLEGMTFAFGATVAIKKEILETIGGMRFISHYLADDFKIGESTAKAGFKVILSDYVVEHSLDTSSFIGMFLHQLRWARGNRFSRPWGSLGTIFTYGTVSSLASYILTPNSIVSFALLVICWSLRYALGWLVGISILRDKIAKKFLYLAPIRDILSFFIWIISWLGSEVYWNNRKLKLSKHGIIREVL